MSGRDDTPLGQGQENDWDLDAELGLDAAESLPVPDFDATPLADLANEIQPVPRLKTPWERALIVASIGLAVGAFLVLVTRVRSDIGVVSPAVTWIPGVLEVLSGLVAIFLGMRWSIPGEGETRARSLGFTGAVVLFATISALVAPHLVPAAHPGLAVGPCVKAGSACVLWQLGAGIPVLGLALWLISRAAPTSTRLAGALAGFGAGLIADAAMHVHCAAVSPSHTILYHLLPVAFLAALGALLASRLARW